MAKNFVLLGRTEFCFAKTPIAKLAVFV